MRSSHLFRIVFLIAGAAIWHSSAQAQTNATPQTIQALIANGQEQAALAQLNPILQAHPDSGVAWYLVAEAQDASGNQPAARSALAKAQQYAPGLPFANPQKAAALQAHLAGPATSPVQTSAGVSPAMIIIAALVVLFILLRFLRSRRVAYPPGFQSGYGVAGRPPAGPFPYGGGTNYGPGAGMPGAGLGGSILGGLAAGAGFAAGERIFDGLAGGTAEQPFNNPNPIDPAPAPDRDDGLTGSPGWDDGNSGLDNNNTSGDFDPNNSW